MPKLTIDGIEVEVAPGTSIIQAADQAGIEIPRFCYHDKLSVPANCRMCLVQVEKQSATAPGMPKPAPSCALPCAEGMVVSTKSEMATKARKNVMEMLLVNHPLDCPICDQGGECDLQDQAVAYGYDRSRYTEEKRAVKDKDLGPLVKTVMTRCIHCTRCVRFGEEVAGVNDMGVLGRGEHLEIGTYVSQMVHSELSGNLIDVCPVGALTSKPYAFTARPWELRKTQSIDVSDAVGANIRIDARGGEVLRILPRLNEDVNEEWISDKARFAVDGLKMNRIDKPYVRKYGKLVPASWHEAFEAIAHGFKGKKAGAVIGDLADAESIIALKDLMKALGSTNIECRQDGAQYDASAPYGYLFNSTIAGLEAADAILLVGANPRVEAALVNARILKGWRDHRVKVGVIGEKIDLNYPYQYLGAGPETLENLGSFGDVLAKAQNPVVILGAGALRRADGLAIHALAGKVAAKYKAVFNLLHTQASRVGALMLGFTGGDWQKAEALYLLGTDELKVDEKAFVVYQGHHGEAMAARADVVLPGAAYTEKNGTYVNLEGRVQTARQAVFPVGEAKEDWRIIHSVAAHLGHPLGYDTLTEARARLVKENAAFGKTDAVTQAQPAAFGKEGAVEKKPFVLPIRNFYMTDPISRASKTMQQCTEAFVSGQKAVKHG